MTDIVDRETRSRMMAAVKGRDTKPEMLVRRMLRELGYPGYRLHRKDVPGRPDICFVGRKKAIFVNGCFWHGHDCGGCRMPGTNAGFWEDKIEKNRERDCRNWEKLTEDGWGVLVVWECELKAIDEVSKKLSAFMGEGCRDETKAPSGPL